MDAPPHPLETTARAAHEAAPWVGISIGPPASAGFLRCSDVDDAWSSARREQLAGQLVREYGHSHPMTVAGMLLDGIALVPGHVGGSFFRSARRVPRLDPAAVAFRISSTPEAIGDIALLDTRFWCLPDDPAAGHEDAQVVDTAADLGQVLRRQVRAHAQAVLPGVRTGATLPRRGVLGAFHDAIEEGLWYGGDPGAGSAERIVGDAAIVLPGGTPEFPDAATFHILVDDRGRRQPSRRRIGCCYYFRVSPDGEACATCPRTDDRQRARMYAEYPD